MNCLKIKIEGLNNSKIINALISDGVYIKNLSEKVRYTTFEILQEDEKKLKSICKKFHKKYEVVSRFKIINILKKSKFYFGFILSMVLVFALIFSFNLYVYKVNLVVGSYTKIDLSNIEKILDDNKIASGMLKSDLDTKHLQDLILKEENIAGCEIVKRGGILDIVIYPATKKEEKKTENIYSKFNAVISKIDVFAGKSNLKIGDIVRKGDLIIENDNGADGEILGKVYYSDYLIYNENQVLQQETGRILVENKLMLFNKILSKSKKITAFSNYLEEKCVFSVSENLFIPLSFVKVKYKEIEYVEKIVPFESVEEKLKNELYNSILEKLENKDTISSVSFSVVKENNLTRLDCFIECEIDLVKD